MYLLRWIARRERPHDLEPESVPIARAERVHESRVEATRILARGFKIEAVLLLGLDCDLLGSSGEKLRREDNDRVIGRSERGEMFLEERPGRARVIL